MKAIVEISKKNFTLVSVGSCELVYSYQKLIGIIDRFNENFYLLDDGSLSVSTKKQITINTSNYYSNKKIMIPSKELFDKKVLETLKSLKDW